MTVHIYAFQLGFIEMIWRGVIVTSYFVNNQLQIVLKNEKDRFYYRLFDSIKFLL